MMKKLFLTLILLFGWSASSLAFPALTGRVVDNANILSGQTRNYLDELLQGISESQIVVVTLPSLEGKTIEEYGYQLGRFWGIGEKGKDNGVLLIIAPNERLVRIEVGYGLEEILTDVISAIIIGKMMPNLKQNDYNNAAINGTEAIIKVLANRKNPKSLPKTIDNRLDTFEFIFIINFTILFILLVLREILIKKYKGTSKQNHILFFTENVFINSLEANIFALAFLYTINVIAYFVVLIIAMTVVNYPNWQRWKKNPSFPYKKQWRVGRDSLGGGGGSFGGGGGSFGGGGGSFGGGGASGRF